MGYLAEKLIKFNKTNELNSSREIMILERFFCSSTPYRIYVSNNIESESLQECLPMES